MTHILNSEVKNKWQSALNWFYYMFDFSQSLCFSVCEKAFTLYIGKFVICVGVVVLPLSLLK